MQHSFKVNSVFILLAAINFTVHANAQQNLQSVTFDAKERSYGFRTSESKLQLQSDATVLAPPIFGVKKIYTSKKETGSFYMAVFVRVKAERTIFIDSNTTFIITFVDSTQKRFASGNDTTGVLSKGEENAFVFYPDDMEDKENFLKKK